MWASDQQLVGRRETSPEGRGSLKSVGPATLMGCLPSGDVGRAFAPLIKPQQHWVQKSPDDVSNSDTVFH